MLARGFAYPILFFLVFVYMLSFAFKTKDAKDFVKSLISVSPSARPGADEALSHPWMKASGEHLRSFPVSNDSFKVISRVGNTSSRSSVQP